MKNLNLPFILMSLIVVLFTSCDTDDNVVYENYVLATPVVTSLTEIRNSISVEEPINMVETGKMYAYLKLIFVNELNKGVHVINNSNPETPQKIAFLKIPGNVDISVKDGFLYADSYVDLVVFDISNLNDITFVNRLENVFPTQNFNYPVEADDFNLSEVDFENEIVTDWILTEETRPVTDVEILEDNTSGDSNTGSGGSLARFKMVSDYLYVVDYSDLHVFNISNLSNPIPLETQHIGWEIETIFNYEDYLYIGSSRGMFIYNITNPQMPQYVSEIQHIEGCDPVVVQGNYAYVTVRGGNFCGQEISQLDVIDISNKTNPFIVASIEMDEPYGLGVHDNHLFVSDGNSGLKIFNIALPESIYLETTFSELIIFDVIPLEETLLLIGNNTLYQYSYQGSGISLISAFVFE